MPVTTANQTFRNAVLPVLSELDVHFISEDVQIDPDSSFLSLVSVFNFNNPTWFLGISSTLLGQTPTNTFLGIRTRASSQNSPLTTDPATGILRSQYRLSGDKGIKVIAGIGINNVLFASGPFWHYKLVIVSNNPDNDNAQTVNPSSFHKLLFIGANPANPQTLVYDIVA